MPCCRQAVGVLSAMFLGSELLRQECPSCDQAELEQQVLWQALWLLACCSCIEGQHLLQSARLKRAKWAPRLL